MKKNLLLIVGTILFGVVIIVSSSNGQDKEKRKKKNSKSTSIYITEDDTIINGKKFRELSKEDKLEFEKMSKEMQENRLNLDKEMRELNKEMEKMNREIIIMTDSLSHGFSFDSDNDRVIIRAPKAPRHPHHPRSLKSMPPIPDLPPMEFSDFGNRTFVFDNDDSESQVYVFNDGNKKTVIKLMKASPGDLKKIGTKADEEIKMFPNPAKDQITLNFNFSESSPVTINLYDDEGKLVKTETIKDYKSGNYEKVYSMNDFEDGTYLVEFVQKNLKVVRKLVIRR